MYVFTFIIVFAKLSFVKFFLISFGAGTIFISNFDITFYKNKKKTSANKVYPPNFVVKK